jgi:Uma2 family endonuclease
MKLAVFPDVMVHCGPFDREATSLSDPVVLFEVVSPGSAVRDRVEKGGLYLRLPSLQHSVLVDRDRPSVEVVSRVDARSWTEPETIVGLEQTVSLPALGLGLPLVDIYRDVIG